MVRAYEANGLTRALSRVLAPRTRLTALVGCQANEINLRVKRLEPEAEYVLRVAPTMEMSTFRERLEEVCSVPAAQQRLIFRGRVLSDLAATGEPLTLAGVGLEDGHTLHLVVRAREVAAAAAGASGACPLAVGLHGKHFGCHLPPR